MADPGLTAEAMDFLMAHPWPGNVRELANALQKALIFNRGGPITADDLRAAAGEAALVPADAGNGESVEAVLRRFIRAELTRASGQSGGSRPSWTVSGPWSSPRPWD